MLITLQSTPSPNVEAHNAKGQSIQDLAAAAMSFGSDASSDDEPLAGPSSPAKRARLHYSNTGSGPGPPDELDDESEWQARLREESGAELRGGDAEDWDRYAQACIRTSCLLQHCHACAGPHAESAGCLHYLSVHVCVPLYSCHVKDLNVSNTTVRILLPTWHHVQSAQIQEHAINSVFWCHHLAFASTSPRLPCRARFCSPKLQSA